MATFCFFYLVWSKAFTRFYFWMSIAQRAAVVCNVMSRLAVFRMGNITCYFFHSCIGMRSWELSWSNDRAKFLLIVSIRWSGTIGMLFYTRIES